MLPTIQEIMITEIHQLTTTNSLQDAKNMMANRKIRHIPISDPNGQFVGLISQRDVIAACCSSLHQVSPEIESEMDANIPLSRLMKQDVISISPRHSCQFAAKLMQKHKIGCLPVLEGGDLVGIVTDSDFVAVAINLMDVLAQATPDEPFADEG